MKSRNAAIDEARAADAPSHLSEALVRAGQADRAGMAEVYRLTRVKLFAVCYAIARDRSVAEEVLHDVYITVWRVAERFDPQRGSAMAWLITLARNRSVDHYRQATYLTREPPEALETIVDPQPSAEVALIVSETHARIHSSLNSIEPRAQRLIRAAFFDGATYAELAKQEGVPLPTMKSTFDARSPGSATVSPKPERTQHSRSGTTYRVAQRPAKCLPRFDLDRGCGSWPEHSCSQ